LFQPLNAIRKLRVSWFKTLEHSISFNTSYWPDKKKRKKCSFRITLFTVCLQ